MSLDDALDVLAGVQRLVRPALPAHELELLRETGLCGDPSHLAETKSVGETPASSPRLIQRGTREKRTAVVEA